ncbi:MAG: hypothetical protein V7L25_15790 [Nostoc sp.]|uniref:hypothetical protein n=1 Tax=Nostoc sp. TaxID=1180 RepID=UPI002FF41DAA
MTDNANASADNAIASIYNAIASIYNAIASADNAIASIYNVNASTDIMSDKLLVIPLRDLSRAAPPLVGYGVHISRITPLNPPL